MDWSNQIVLVTGGTGRDQEALGKTLPDGFRYAANTNPQWLTIEQIQHRIASIETAYLQGRLE
jgi:hypothetical protein